MPGIVPISFIMLRNFNLNIYFKHFRSIKIYINYLEPTSLTKIKFVASRGTLTKACDLDYK